MRRLFVRPSSPRCGQQRDPCRARRSNFDPGDCFQVEFGLVPIGARKAGRLRDTQLDLECLGAAPSRIWALDGASRRTPHSFRSGLTASILISFKTSLACGMASLPAGNWFALRT